ncbi:hypothetical protein TTHERM_00352230 (macronuclear) [Tetrahymena thermophila SB210]|uniref:Transmembrane protein n=1 Tax=Tetrahymena thermophila (strain SB210) TaxID=312017 RepID=I7LWT8_TETTS|nr:hypothetical protein TTHERM_00352230 [Tetrahymena thermophila SB210]EAS02836.1 hypothetical protein TTHERM_00352230 [Tetrahymena thermophila SB210]|eukprot:XP_001023081.1 hypothetical protein TTHERM_00352230 [Tetrahymena thermophila SB210]
MIKIVIFAFCLGLVLSNTISLPLTFNSHGLGIEVRYGTQQCPTFMVIDTFSCDFQVFDKESSQCGINELKIKDKNYYNAPFQIGQISTELNFTIPNSDKGLSLFCLAPVAQSFNVIQELYDQKLINNRTFFFNVTNLDNSIAQESIDVGFLNIGEPDYSLIKSGTKANQLKSYDYEHRYSIRGSNKFRYDGESIPLHSIQTDQYFPFEFSYIQNCITLNKKSIKAMLKAFELKAIKYSKYNEGDIYVDKIEGMGDFEFDLYQEDGQIFTVSLAPQEYSERQSDGTYYLRFCEPFGKVGQQVVLGQQIFNKYYVGYNLDHNSNFIAEKAQIQIEQI